jgi:hypothetical protein
MGTSMSATMSHTSSSEVPVLAASIGASSSAVVQFVAEANQVILQLVLAAITGAVGQGIVGAVAMRVGTSVLREVASRT